MKFSKDKYDNAVNDFINGNGTGCPSKEVCEILMRFDKSIQEECLKAVKNNLTSISIMPYGESIMIAKNPVYKGPYTTTMNITLDSHTTLVHFDRN